MRTKIRVPATGPRQAQAATAAARAAVVADPLTISPSSSVADAEPALPRRDPGSTLPRQQATPACATDSASGIPNTAKASSFSAMAKGKTPELRYNLQSLE